MANVLRDMRANLITGLNTWVFTVVNPNVYNVQVQSTVNPPTGLSIAIYHNATLIVTSAVPSAAQEFISIATNISTVAADTISVVFSSAVLNDSLPNNVKSIVTISGA